MTPEDIGKILTVARECGVASLTYSLSDHTSLRVDFRGPVATVESRALPRPPIMDAPPDPGPERLTPDQHSEFSPTPDWCACGHSLSVEHNAEALCFHGCDEEKCGSKAPAVERPGEA